MAVVENACLMQRFSIEDRANETAVDVVIRGASMRHQEYSSYLKR
jgi:hypothetical protein